MAKVDVNKHAELVKLMKGFDVVANAVYYETVLQVTRSAIEAKVHVVDLGGFFYGTMKQMELDGELKKSGITLLHGCGSSPGFTNVLARYAANKLDRVDEIHIMGGGPVPAPGSPPPKGSRCTVRAIVDELTYDHVIYADGEFKKLPNITGRQEVRFSDPVGLQTLYYCLHSEPCTLSKYIKGVKVVDVKGEFDDEIVSKVSTL